jgi:endonuclease III
MKNASVYLKKIKSFLSTLKKRPPGEKTSDLEPMDSLILGILRQDTTRQQGLAGLKALRAEFVDYNEMRVAPPKDIADLLGPDMPLARLKAEMVTGVLNRVLDHGNDMNLQFLSDIGKRELPAYLHERLGFDSYSEAYVTLHVLDGHAIPVDRLLAQKLKDEDLVHPEADVAEIRSALERSIPAKGAIDVFEALSAYAATPAKTKPAARSAEPAAAKTKAKAAKPSAAPAKSAKTTKAKKKSK